MAAKGENSRCLYKDGAHKIVVIDSDEEKAAKSEGWTNKPGEPKAKEVDPKLAPNKEDIPQLAKKKTPDKAKPTETDK